MLASQHNLQSARRLHGGALRRPLVTGGVTRAAGTPVKTKEGKPGRVKPAAACTADPEAAAGGARQGAAAVCVFIHCCNETKGLLQGEGGLTSSRLLQARAVGLDFDKAEDLDIAPFNSESDLYESSSAFRPRCKLSVQPTAADLNETVCVSHWTAVSPKTTTTKN